MWINSTANRASIPGSVMYSAQFDICYTHSSKHSSLKNLKNEIKDRLTRISDNVSTKIVMCLSGELLR